MYPRHAQTGELWEDQRLQELELEPVDLLPMLSH